MIKEWILEYFIENSDEKTKIDTEVNYMEIGIIDSFGLIEFIEELENEFSIKFTNDDFSNRKFVTVGGLTEIVFNKISK